MEEGWLVVVNVRQEHVCHLRTFFHLEQISVWTNLGILRNVKKIKYNNIDGSLSFGFRILSDASNVVRVIRNIVPVRCYVDRIVPPPDERYIFNVEIAPICCGDLIFLPPNVAGPNIIGPIVICTRVAKTFTLLDPFTLNHCFLKSDQYWNAPFTPYFTTTNLVEYVVHDIFLEDNEEEVVEEKKEKKRIIEDENDDADAADDADAKKYRLADAVVAPVKDNGTTFRVKTHLGRILKPGDHALGYDLSGAITNTIANLPDAILIAKTTTTCDAENGRVLVTHDKWESDYRLFVKDLQQDTKLIFNMRAAYRNPNNRHPSDENIISPFRRSFVPLQDLLDG